MTFYLWIKRKGSSIKDSAIYPPSLRCNNEKIILAVSKGIRDSGMYTTFIAWRVK